jgi:hypothetical protein
MSAEWGQGCRDRNPVDMATQYTNKYQVNFYMLMQISDQIINGQADQ